MRRATVRIPVASFRLDLRVLATIAVVGALGLVVFTAHIARGEFAVPAGEVLQALVGAGDRATNFVVLDLRLPRALTALLAGAALAIAGAIFQDMARNPLVAPDVIGVTTGASVAAVALIVLGGPSHLLPPAALAGALAAGTLLYALAWRGGVQGYRLVLVGIGVAAALHAVVSYLLTRGQIYEVREAYIWIVGSLNGRGWNHVWPLLGAVAVLLPLAVVLARALEALQLGDEVARALGARVERARLGLLGVALCLTAFAVASAGPVAFVAFIAPHIARRISGTVAPTSVLLVAGACGALLMLTADLAGRLLFSPTEIPVGIVTSIIAAPYFLYLLQRANRAGATG